MRLLHSVLTMMPKTNKSQRTSAYHEKTLARQFAKPFDFVAFNKAAISGELSVGGEGVVRGYLDRPELTAERFVTHPWRHEPSVHLYRTGDLTCYRPDGTIEFLGRLDQQVKRRGYRIELGQIVTVLAHHPGVQQAVVASSADATPEEERLVAYMVAQPHAIPTSSELQHFPRDTLSDFMVPSGMVFLDAFPLTPNGKVERRALPALDQARPEAAGAFVAPQMLVEEVLAGIWRKYWG